jgi:hypothetical protein
LGSSLPPAELARRDSAPFGEVKRLFSIAPKVGKETEANGGHCVHRTRHRTLHRTRSLCDQRVRSGDQRFTRTTGRGARPVTGHRTRPVVQGAYWTPTGRGHCGVRWVLQRVRWMFRGARFGVDRRVRWVTGPARPVVTSASGGSVGRVRSTVTASSDAHYSRLSRSDRTRPVTLTGASGARDFNCVVSNG